MWKERRSLDSKNVQKNYDGFSKNNEEERKQREREREREKEREGLHWQKTMKKDELQESDRNWIQKLRQRERERERENTTKFFAFWIGGYNGLDKGIRGRKR